MVMRRLQKNGMLITLTIAGLDCKLWIGMNFAKLKTSKQAWDSLSRLYHQSSDAQAYQLEIDIRMARQGDKSIQEFYSEMRWDAIL